ncbi:MAG: translation elongation factor Ts [Rickettsiales bacterium]|jgi:elongation factor Ts|nr:translation elongation factor Ts [Rickettsiales bacterium]
MVDLALVKKLREATGCGVSDCSAALASANGDYSGAVEWLRRKGLSVAAKKSAKVATEGLVAVYSDGRAASLVEVNSETDFVAKNEKFQELVLQVAKAALNVRDSANFVESLRNQSSGGRRIEDEFTDKINIIGENLQLRRGKRVELVGSGVIATYVHSKVSENLGKIAVLVVLGSNAVGGELEELGKQLAMHIAASRPEFFRESDVPPERIEKERAIFAEQAKNSGKPQPIAEKMVASKMKKFYEENCLMNQLFVMDNSTKISDLLAGFAKKSGAPVEIQSYAYFVLGEGLDKKENNFASEVRSMLN